MRVAVDAGGVRRRAASNHQQSAPAQGVRSQAMREGVHTSRYFHLRRLPLEATHRRRLWWAEFLLFMWDCDVKSGLFIIGEKERVSIKVLYCEIYVLYTDWSNLNWKRFKYLALFLYSEVNIFSILLHEQNWNLASNSKLQFVLIFFFPQ